MDRRFLLGAAAATFLVPGSGKVTAQAAVAPVEKPAEAGPDPLAPRIVRIRKTFAPGEIHVVPQEFALYWTMPGQKAIRYAVGIGRPGLYEPGVFFIGAKKEWPEWTPTPEMIERNPKDYKQFEDGMPGGPNNPLGARALYLFVPGRGDSFLRIHGTNLPKTIGTAVSNGCARLTNEYIVDLYQRVPIGARVVLYQS